MGALNLLPVEVVAVVDYSYHFYEVVLGVVLLVRTLAIGLSSSVGRGRVLVPVAEHRSHWWIRKYWLIQCFHLLWALLQNPCFTFVVESMLRNESWEAQLCDID
jgi:hypothetical protein